MGDNITYLENWFEGEPFLEGARGIEFTKTLKDIGYVSRDECEAYEYVENVLTEFLLLNGEKEFSSSILRRIHEASTKDQKRQLYCELGYENFLENALSMTTEEIKTERAKYSGKLRFASREEKEKIMGELNSSHSNKNL